MRVCAAATATAICARAVVGDPLRRVNTGDNTPACSHPASGARRAGAASPWPPRASGSENMSRLAMLKPADGEQGVKEFVLDTVKLGRFQPLPAHCGGRWHRRQL